MKTFIQGLGYKFTTNDDLTDRQFRNVDTNLEYDEELSTMGNPRHLITSVWQISLKDYNPVLFNNKLLDLYNSIGNMTSKEVFFYTKSTNNKGEFYLESYSVDTELEENRTLINLTFIIRGK